MNDSIIPLLAVLCLGLMIKVIISIIRTLRFKINHQSPGDQIVEFLCIYIFPGVRLNMTDSRCEEHPFNIENMLTPHVLWLLFCSGHAISRYYKQKASPLLLLLATSLMITGVIYCTVICVHFSSLGLVALIPILQLLFLSPLFCLIYLVRELYNLNLFIKEQSKIKQITGNTTLSAFQRLLEKHHLGFALFLLAPFLALIQSCLYLVGQRPDSLLSQFTESCGYLLSNEQFCSCGGDHYLCSIAANGSSALVKPVRMGMRQNEKILVNRQLLIANAFENWLEDYTPCFHKLVRTTYDNMKIPVNAWSKHKRYANILYVLMKPLEWLFLLWLYFMDKDPESRIARQYLPKQEIENFINNTNHENNH